MKKVNIDENLYSIKTNGLPKNLFAVLNKRLDDRVDSMIEQGLIDEMTKFHENYNMTRLEQKQ